MFSTLAFGGDSMEVFLIEWNPHGCRVAWKAMVPVYVSALFYCYCIKANELENAFAIYDV